MRREFLNEFVSNLTIGRLVAQVGEAVSHDEGKRVIALAPHT
jgi:hypothetical protein